MLVNFKNKLIDFDGKEAESFDYYVVNAIAPQDKTLSYVQQLDNYNLAMKIRQSVGDIEINLTEQKCIMDGLVKNMALPLVTGRFEELFNQKPITE